MHWGQEPLTQQLKNYLRVAISIEKKSKQKNE